MTSKARSSSGTWLSAASEPHAGKRGEPLRSGAQNGLRGLLIHLGPPWATEQTGDISWEGEWPPSCQTEAGNSQEQGASQCHQPTPPTCTWGTAAAGKSGLPAGIAHVGPRVKGGLPCCVE